MVLQCYHYKYNSTAVASESCSGSFEECATLVKCNTEGTTSDPICFALAKPAKNSTNTNDTIILSGGCYPSTNQEVCDKNCLGHQKPNGNYYCCCTNDGCNKKLIPRSITVPSTTPTSTTTTRPEKQSSSNNPILAFSVILVIFLIVFVVAIGVYFKRSRRKRIYMGDGRINQPRELNDLRLNQDTSVMLPFRNTFVDENHDQQRNNNENHHSINQASRVNHNNSNAINRFTTNNIQHSHQQPTQQHQQEQPQPTTPIIDLKRIKLLELVGSGRFGTVHKATLAEDEADDSNSDSHDDAALKRVKSSEIAVKIIPSNEYQSWQNELKIYSSPKTRHPNILNFLGSTESPETSSYWLLVEYASNGSLHHYLKENTVTWPEFLTISSGIVRGLSHLHDADIAHRDFKSKNVLLRHNLSPCITDFGVASMLNSSGGSQTEQRKKYLQVGTPRYMAPEVLECSVSFTKISFIKIDVYALSLTLWELLSRCYPLPRTSDCDDSLVSISYQGNQQNFLPPPHIYQAPHTPGSPSKSRVHHHQTSTPISDSPINPDGDADDCCEDVNMGLLEPVGCDTIDCATSSSRSTTNLALQSPNQQRLNPMNQEVPMYQVPFEGVVGPNPDINIMRQVVVSDRIRPPIRPEWNFYPLSKLSQAIVDGWEYDHDARISASCFVERIECLQQEHLNQLKDQSRLPAATTT